MSARVFNRLAMSQDPPAPRGDPCAPELDRVRRVLFGPVDRAVCRQFAEQQLAEHRERVSGRYNFDFVTFAPRNDATNARYQWVRVDPNADRVPEAYAMERLPYLSGHADDSGEGASASTAAGAESGVVAKDVDVTTTGSCSSSASCCQGSARQSSITDFLKKRKAVAQDTVSEATLKKLRTTTSEATTTTTDKKTSSSTTST